jgi:hypothetical protein
MSTPKTAIIGNFPGQKQAPKTAKKPPSFVDLDALTICDDPLPIKRAVVGLKYESVFLKMKAGQCIKCPTDNVGQISGALRKHIERHNLKDHIVRATPNYEGTGVGRVWLLYVGPKGGEA